MDIDLLAKMVKDEILEHDRLTLPGVGSFQADLMPSTFSDKGYTIHPPYRRLYFTQKEGDDTILADRYALDNGISRDDAAVVLVDFLTQLKEVLKVRKTIVFPGLGRLRATRENNFFFVADEDLDIYPEGMKLEPVSLKNNIQTQSEVRRAVERLSAEMTGTAEEGIDVVIDYPSDADITVAEPIVSDEPVDSEEPVTVEEPLSAEVPVAPEEPVAAEEPVVLEEPIVAEEPVSVEEPVVVEEPVEPVVSEEEPTVPEEPAESVEPVKVAETPEPQPEAKPKKEPKPRKKSRFWHFVGVFLLVLLIIALVVAAAWFIIGRVAPEIIDPLLYSPEELEILRWKP